MGIFTQIYEQTSQELQWEAIYWREKPLLWEIRFLFVRMKYSKIKKNKQT